MAEQRRYTLADDAWYILAEHPWYIIARLMTASHADKELVGAAQSAALLPDTTLPFHAPWCVEVAASRYSQPAYLHANRQQQQLVSVVRLRGCRTVYPAPPLGPQPRQAGHPCW